MKHPSPESTDDQPGVAAPEITKTAASYWRANLTVVVALLAVWFIISYVISIFTIDSVNSIQIGKLGLGFWFAQQGSILTFVILVWLYALVMDFVDRKFQNHSL